MRRFRRATRLWMAGAIVLIVATAATLAALLTLGDFGIRDSWTLRRFGGQQSFSAEAWRRGDPHHRGAMLVHFAHTHRFRGMHRDSVVALLGPAECYVVQDGWPCYDVALGGRPRTLEFLLSYEIPLTVRRVRLGSPGDYY